MEADGEGVLIWMHGYCDEARGEGGAFVAFLDGSFDAGSAVGVELEVRASIQGAGPVRRADGKHAVEGGVDVLDAIMLEGFW